MLQQLVNYTLLADKMIVDAFLDAARPMPEAEHLFSHVLNAQDIWANRILRKSEQYDRFQIHPVGDFERIQLNNSDLLLQILQTVDLDEQIIYSPAAGGEYVNKVSDILFHVVNHSTYHRAQVVSQIRANGLTPPSTDYILFKREGLL